MMHVGCWLLLVRVASLPHKKSVVAAFSNGAEMALSQGQVWALVDYFVCSELPQFIGKSVSTFSAIQIAKRNGEGTFWYNSQSIPLASIWRTYHIPIVYTYTELSKSSGKHMLQASITSVREHMPNNMIHILYHGRNDTSFRDWLGEKGVIVHDHDPHWKNDIDAMRKNGDPATSSLYLHEGNHFGTWQRIDIPLFVKTEYCLLLDSDTIVMRPFTIADMGLTLTSTIAMSTEFDMQGKTPTNAGVLVMNVPNLKRTYNAFLDFILDHVETAKFDIPCPVDQGAYLDFYRSSVQFLSSKFNFKPYWKAQDQNLTRSFIVHFHGAKPHDYLKFIMGTPCDEAILFLCEQVRMLPLLCPSIQRFARSSKSVDPTAYCEASFVNEGEITFCNNVMDTLVSNDDACNNFTALIENELAHARIDQHEVPTTYGKEKLLIRQQRPVPTSNNAEENVGSGKKSRNNEPTFDMLHTLIGSMTCWLLFSLVWFKQRRKQWQGILALLTLMLCAGTWYLLLKGYGLKEDDWSENFLFHPHALEKM